MSPLTLVVATVEPTGSTPMGPAIDVIFNFSGGRCRIHRQHPQEARHRRPLQLWWWPLLDPLTAPLGDPPSMPCNRW
jgi:hypothetical protein